MQHEQERLSESSELAGVSVTVPGTGARLILVLGGARSGKSTFAEKLAANSQRSVAYIATATASDEEMQARIVRHRAQRPQAWRTLEEPLDLAGAVWRASSLADVLLLDCVTLWTSNWLMQQVGIDWNEQVVSDMLFTENALKEVEAMLQVLRALPTHKTLIVVSNEIGAGLVPEYALGRAYRDTLGYVNQCLARSAERVYLLVAGIAVDLKRLQEEAIL
jgi:adenosylcobinamide kinase/adenosylcobinamide-phosphate guanylyltransferase